MKKFVAITLALVMMLVFIVACDDNAADDVFRVALITHSPNSILEDASFNQGAWEGIVKFARSNALEADQFDWFQPIDGTDDFRVNLMEEVISDFGADALVLPGFDFNISSHRAQFLFPDAYFILLDTQPIADWGQPAEVNSNLVAIFYAEEQAGFLAGYAAVMDGYRQLGFIGGRAVPAVVRFGYGFIQGAEHAAKELGLGAGDVQIRYHYSGTFAPDPAIATLSGSWYADGTEVIFVAGGRIFDSIIPQAEQAGAKMIGVDGDQSGLSPVIITSAMKDLAQSVVDMLEAIQAGTFPGGQTLTYDAAGRGVGLPMATSRFNSFSQAQYDAIYAALANGSVIVDNTFDENWIANVFSPNSLVTVNVFE